MVERWFQLDALGLLQQLGLTVVPGPWLLPRSLVGQLNKLRKRPPKRSNGGLAANFGSLHGASFLGTNRRSQPTETMRIRIAVLPGDDGPRRARPYRNAPRTEARRAVRILCKGGDAGNRTRVRGRVEDGVYERSRRSDLALDSPAGGVVEGQLPVSPRIGGSKSSPSKPAVDPVPPPQASDGRDDLSYRLSSRVTEIETVRVRTY